ncbi:hypothetical protein AAHC03_013673 [Spirometra sp. Aus1]
MNVVTELCDRPKNPLDRLTLGHHTSKGSSTDLNQNSVNFYENLARLSAEILKMGEVVPNKRQISEQPPQPRGVSISDPPVPKSPAELLSQLDVNKAFCWILENWIHSQLPEHLPVNHDFLLEIVALVLEILAQKSSEHVFQLGRHSKNCPADLNYLSHLQQVASCGTCSQCNPKRDFLLSSSLGLHAILHHNENTPQALLNLTVEQIEVVASEVFHYLSDDHNSPLLNSIDNSARLTKFHKDLSQTSALISPASFATFPRSPSLSTGRDGSVSSTPAAQTQNHCKKGRTRLDSSQLSILWANFNLNSSPSDEKVSEICLQTGLKEKVVKHWFRNTLFKERQRSKDSPYNFSIPPSTNLDLEKYERTGKVETWPATPMKTRTPPVSVAATYSCEVTHVKELTESATDLRRAALTETECACATPPNGQPYRVRDMKKEFGREEDVMMIEEAEEGEGRSSKGASPSPTTSSEKGCLKKQLLGGKRIRTAISQSQQILLSRFFHNDPNPSRRQMDIIAGSVGLPKRVVQVWFQNARSRERKLGYPLPTGSLCRQANLKPSTVLNGPLPNDHLYPVPTSPSALLTGPLRDSQIWDSKLSPCEVQRSEQQQQQQQLRYHPGAFALPAVGDLWRFKTESIPPALHQVAFPYSMANTNVDLPNFSRQSDTGADMGNPTVDPTSVLRNAGSLFQQLVWPGFFSQLLKQQLPPICQPFQWQPGLAATGTTGLGSQSDSPLDLSQRSHHRSCESEVGNRQSPVESLSDERKTKQSPMEWSPGLTLGQSTALGSEINDSIKLPSDGETPNKCETSTAPNQTRRNRTSISCPQARFMQTIYAHHKTPSIFECDRVGQAIGLTRRVVQVWFQNQRAKEKKMARISALGMQPSPTVSATSCESVNGHHGDLVTLATGASECKLCGVLINEAEESGFVDGSRGSGFAAAMESDKLIDHLFSTMHLSRLLNSCNQPEGS